MRSDWILDVLADLRSFADANALPLLQSSSMILRLSLWPRSPRRMRGLQSR